MSWKLIWGARQVQWKPPELKQCLCPCVITTKNIYDLDYAWYFLYAHIFSVTDSGFIWLKVSYINPHWSSLKFHYPWRTLDMTNREVVSSRMVHPYGQIQTEIKWKLLIVDTEPLHYFSTKHTSDWGILLASANKNHEHWFGERAKFCLIISIIHQPTL